MIKESAVYHFIDKGNQYALTIFNGSHFMQDLAKWQNFGPNEIKVLRPLVLSLQCLLTVIKNNESFGAYINNDGHGLRFNMESHSNGNSRLLLKSQDELPEKLNGVCRFVKFQPNDTAPYTSLIELNDTSYKDVVTQIITQSYQFDANVEIFEENNLSIILTKFPHVKEPLEKVANYESIYKNVLESFAVGQDEESTIKQIADGGYTFLSIKRVNLQCRCTRDKLVMTFRNLAQSSQEEIFQDGPIVDVNCDYCGKLYQIKEDDLKVQ
jgi:redox-regulated HSP33 family molecular chaperone